MRLKQQNRACSRSDAPGFFAICITKQRSRAEQRDAMSGAVLCCLLPALLLSTSRLHHAIQNKSYETVSSRNVHLRMLLCDCCVRFMLVACALTPPSPPSLRPPSHSSRCRRSFLHRHLVAPLVLPHPDHLVSPFLSRTFLRRPRHLRPVLLTFVIYSSSSSSSSSSPPLSSRCSTREVER